MGAVQSTQQYANNLGTTAEPQLPTLVSAFAQLDELNQRLAKISSNAIEVAQAIGGPYPIPSDGKDVDNPLSAMHRLHAAIRDAHSRVSYIEEALASVRRSLGA